MKKRLMKLSKKPFVRNVIILSSGTIMAQVIAMTLSPIITRLYGPEAYGLMGTFMAIVSIIAPIAALTYPIAIVLPKRDQDAKGLIRLSLIITTIISVIFLIILMLFNKQILNIFNIKEIGAYLYLIPLVIIFSGFMEVAEQWLIRTKQFSINARVTVLQSIVINGGKIGIGLYYPIAAVLVVLSAFGNGLKAAMMIFFAKRSNYQENKQLKGKKTGLRELAKQHSDFPKYRAPQVFLNGLSSSLPVILLTTFFGPASAGFYTLGRTVLSAPSQLIGKSVGDVFYPRIAQAANNNENITKLLNKATLALAVIGIFPYGIVILFGPTLFSFVFGSDWYVAGEYARWISLFVYFVFINQPSIKSLAVLSAQRFHLIFTIISTILRLLSLVLGYYIFNDDLFAVALFSISTAFVNIFLILMTIKLSKNTIINYKNIK